MSQADPHISLSGASDVRPKVSPRAPIQHNRLRRKEGHDYAAPGIYLITVTTADRRRILGELTGASPDAASIQPTTLGEYVIAAFRKMATMVTEKTGSRIQVYQYQLMPDHFHGILRIHDALPEGWHLSRMIGAWKGDCSREYWREKDLSGAPDVRPEKESLFSPGYNDKILYHKGQLDAWYEYLHDNPRRLWLKMHYPDRLRKIYDFKAGKQGHAYTAVGNTFLIKYPERVQVRCHRNLTEEQIQAEVEHYMSLARGGAVLVSPFISPAEKAVYEAAYKERLKIIRIVNRGLDGKFIYPTGRDLKGCSAGFMLVLAPYADYSAETAEKRITRSQCLDMNGYAADLSTTLALTHEAPNKENADARGAQQRTGRFVECSGRQAGEYKHRKTMKLIAENTESTVVLRYEHKQSQRIAYQSEAQLEDALIEQLQAQGYEYLDIHTEEELIANLRKQLEKLNHIEFTDNEWKGFFRTKLANTGASIADKAELLQDDRTAQLQYIKEDNSGFQNVKLIDKAHIFENSLQVIHQYTPTEGKHRTRYDVTILVNGLPMVHIELKRRGVAVREAFNQIKRYANDSFWADSGLFEYIQLFVISNGSDTKYYSNTTRNKAQIENRKRTNKTGEEQIKKSTKRCDSFEFTSYWADGENNVIRDLDDFTATFFAKHTILNILTRYCVFTADRELMVMRPYQIAATEAIIQKIRIASNQRVLGTIDAGGYIWHTTGSGKTLTSFKTAQLCTQLDYVDKVLFVVDRKDLDYQTVREYEKFKKGCVSSNKSTAVLTKQMGNDNDRIIITTIQKLNSFCKKEKEHSVYGRHVVIIFDECHRSQFGEMHNQIVKRFKRYHIFGFTGTPIFPDNASNKLFTTEKIFGQRLHTYTVISAIADNNVLPFRVEYIKTVDSKSCIADQKVSAIDIEKALLDPKRITNITEYILTHYDQKTFRNHVYTLKDKRVSGFNSILATASIEAARLYYAEFKRQQADLPEDERLKIALIYSYGVNDDDPEANGLLLEEDSEGTSQLDQTDRDFLDNAIADYNAMFACNFDTGDQFANYYKDVSERMKKRELDMLIVVNMFLTGFDATTLNTLWVDKNLRQHGLMQAYSRTNRILNTIKQFGMIVCFRNLEKETNDTIALFGDKDSKGLVLLKTYDEYVHGYTDANGKYHMGFEELVEAMKERFPLDNPQALHMMGEEAEKDFIRVFGTYVRLNNVLSTFDRFEEEKDSYITPAEEQDYRSLYLNLHDKYRNVHDGDKVEINDDLVFEIELIKQVDINIDFIIQLIEQHRAKKEKDKTELMIQIQKAVGSSPLLRNKSELIEEFVRRYAMDREVSQQWAAYVSNQAHKQLDELIADEHLNPEQTEEFMRHAFHIGEVERNGDRITKCLPPLPLFDMSLSGASGVRPKTNNRAETKRRVLDRLCDWFDRFFDIFKFE